MVKNHYTMFMLISWGLGALFILCSEKSLAQGTLRIKIAGEGIGKIYVATPLDGRFFEAHSTMYSPNENSVIEVKVESQKPGFIYLGGFEEQFKEHLIYYTPKMKSTVEVGENLDLQFGGNAERAKRLWTEACQFYKEANVREGLMECEERLSLL